MADSQSRPSEVALTLAQVLAARICHDLAGGLGTLMGALELAADDPAMQAEALPVARDAANTLGQRLRFMRAAWGADDATGGMAELQALAAGIPTGRRVRIVLDGLDPGRGFSPHAFRLLLNLLLLGVESLAGEGLVELLDAAGDDVIIAISGPRAAWPAGFVAQLADPHAALLAACDQGGRLLQAPLTALIAHAAAIRVAMLLSPQTQAAPPLILSLG